MLFGCSAISRCPSLQTVGLVEEVSGKPGLTGGLAGATLETAFSRTVHVGLPVVTPLEDLTVPCLPAPCLGAQVDLQ